MATYTDSLADLLVHMHHMDEKMTDPKFTYDRNGLRLAIAAIEDETGELYDEWRLHKRDLSGAGTHQAIRWELLDIAAIAMHTYARTFDGQD